MQRLGNKQVAPQLRGRWLTAESRQGGIKRRFSVQIREVAQLAGRSAVAGPLALYFGTKAALSRFLVVINWTIHHKMLKFYISITRGGRAVYAAVCKTVLCRFDSCPLDKLPVIITCRSSSRTLNNSLGLAWIICLSLTKKASQKKDR